MTTYKSADFSAEWYRLEKSGQQMWMSRSGVIEFLVDFSGATGKQKTHLHAMIASQPPWKLVGMLGCITEADDVELV